MKLKASPNLEYPKAGRIVFIKHRESLLKAMDRLDLIPLPSDPETKEAKSGLQEILDFYDLILNKSKK